MNKLNACIVYISSRNKCIKKSLQSLWDMYNKKHNYPVYVHYFDDIYDSIEFQDSILNSCPQKVIFKSIPYKTPDFLEEHELYYNRKNLWYVNTGRFTQNRKGYLHMCHFTSNMYGYENTELQKYDYIMTHDDEAGYAKELNKDPFDILSKQDKQIGAFMVSQRLKNGHPHQGHFDTRVGLWEFTKNFLLENNITPKSQILQELLKNKRAGELYHYLKWCDTYVVKTKTFKTEIWKKWIQAINDSGNIYKYRWGDNEIITLYCYMIQDSIHDFNLVKDGTHIQNMFRNIQDYAPSVKDLKK